MTYFEKATEEIVANFLFRTSPTGMLINTLNPIEEHLNTYVRQYNFDTTPPETIRAELKNVAKEYLINLAEWTEADAERFFKMQANDKLSTTPVHVVLTNAAISIRAEIDMDGLAPAYLTKRIEQLQDKGIKIPDVLDGALLILEHLTIRYNNLLESGLDINTFSAANFDINTLPNEGESTATDSHKKDLSEFLYALRLFRLLTICDGEQIFLLIKNQNRINKQKADAK